MEDVSCSAMICIVLCHDLHDPSFHMELRDGDDEATSEEAEEGAEQWI